METGDSLAYEVFPTYIIKHNNTRCHKGAAVERLAHILIQYDHIYGSKHTRSVISLSSLAQVKELYTNLYMHVPVEGVV